MRAIFELTPEEYLKKDYEDVRFVTTRVRFRPMSDKEIQWYVSTGDPLDKAGSYGIQGGAALFCTHMVGDYYNVMGLPVCRLGQLLREIAPEIMEESE